MHTEYEGVLLQPLLPLGCSQGVMKQQPLQLGRHIGLGCMHAWMVVVDAWSVDGETYQQCLDVVLIDKRATNSQLRAVPKVFASAHLSVAQLLVMLNRTISACSLHNHTPKTNLQEHSVANLMHMYTPPLYNVHMHTHLPCQHATPLRRPCKTNTPTPSVLHSQGCTTQNHSPPKLK